MPVTVEGSAMSIFPATDIVADAARAANPQRLHLAMDRLAHAAATRATTPRFAQMTGAAAPGDVRREHDARPMSEATADSRSESAIRKFEAFVLQSWLEMLLPREDTGVFGSGPGAGEWRSLMAEQLGEQVARAGGVGLQRLLAPKRASSET